MSRPQDPKPAAERRQRAGAIALVVLGLVILIPSGLCSVAMGIIAISSMHSATDQAYFGVGSVITILIVSALFATFGAILLYAGLHGRSPK